ncbi:chemotaxis protein CheA [Salinarchaeum sp. IM2453]|uniref:chemotaxis protein CheA n=1 Tax=Salinarchaeum sp. IM2453 TaxID=2862870 RepID=UPI001C83C868|nr:chemotaxis protein CheA [Salinarchaeum sp. IM2453]QZA89331.1 chemotaxis protein CheA [Salinarchaeum sp. IM2453]
MNDEYLDAFLQEADEQITQLNNSLLALESDPDDESAMEEIFRTAHTLKGNFAAMGFDAASDLAHAIEDLLDEIRAGNIAVTSERMDLIFAGVDQIETAVDQIGDTGETQIDPNSLINDLRTEIDQSDTEQKKPDSSSASSLSAYTIDANQVDHHAHELTITLDPGEIKGVDAMLVLETIEEESILLDTDPRRDAIEDGEFEDTFAAVVDVSAPDDLVDELESNSSVDNIDINKLDQQDPDPDSSESTTNLDQSMTTDRSEPSAAVSEIESVRVDVDQLDHLYRLVEQFVTGHVRLERAVENKDIASIEENVEELGKTTETLQDTVIDMRLVPFDTVVGKFPRLVRDLARDQNKEIQFTISGRDVEIDRSILSELGDPLTHLLRNAVDHGIEPPEERKDAGKPPEGNVELRARRERDHVIIEIDDDGAGLDVEDIKETAIEQGVRTADELERMSESELYDLVFHPGFSTSDEVTDVSGRGVGMDVVYQTISKLDGSINVESELGKGTTVTLELPVTMAIVEVLILQVGDEEYGIPIKHVDEITTRDSLSTLDNNLIMEYEDDIYRVIELSDNFDVPNAGAGEKVIRVDRDERRVALTCDDVRAQQTVVVKPLEGLLSGTPGLSGTAILGDGEIMYLIDAGTL